MPPIALIEVNLKIVSSSRLSESGCVRGWTLWLWFSMSSMCVMVHDGHEEEKLRRGWPLGPEEGGGRF